MASVEQFTRYMKEHGQQSRLDELGRTGGGIERAAAEWGGPGQTSQTSVSQNPIDLAKQLFELGSQFRKPAIETLQAGRAGIAPTFEGLRGAAEAQRPTIEQRYKDTLEEITKTTRGAAAQEFTRRGIPLSSGLVEQTVGSRLGPQISQAATQRDVGQPGITQLLANIGVGEFEAGTDLDRAIATIQASGSPEAITAAQNIFGQQQQARQSELSRQLQQQQLAQQQQQFQTGEARELRLDPFQESLLEAQAANQRRLAGGGDGTPFTPTTATGVQATFGAGPAYTPSGGEGSFDRQPDGSIWEFSGGRWTQRG